MTRPLRIPIDHDDEHDHDEPVVTSPQERKEMRDRRKEEAKIEVDGYDGRGRDVQVSITPDTPDDTDQQSGNGDSRRITPEPEQRRNTQKEQAEKQDRRQKALEEAVERVKERLREKGMSESFIDRHESDIRKKVRVELSRDHS